MVLISESMNVRETGVMEAVVETRAMEAVVGTGVMET